MTKIISTSLVNNIRELLTISRQQLQNSVNIAMLNTYWQVGKLIVEEEQNGQERAEYGTKQLEFLAHTLECEFGRGFDARNLRNMRKLYLLYPIWNAVRTKLTWTHHRILMRITNESAREWYANECEINHWSSRALERQIGALYYERLLSSKDKNPVIREALDQTDQLKTNVRDYLRDPYILDFLNLPSDSILESNIEQGLIDNLQKFLLELGRGFAFVKRQQRISIEDQNFAIDLVFYNFKLKFFLLIDIKLGRLTHQDVGQMDTYVRIYDEHYKSADDNPTVGLILCSEKSEAIARYSILKESKQIFAAKYLPYLPTEDELKFELERERAILIQNNFQIENKSN
ncbi:MAG: PDDEXK nuclease domain-containing protein [Burkholderiales bacterium]|nr:PDDEXK nuclease domain-containing protein [Burkholderiales bacterium]